MVTVKVRDRLWLCLAVLVAVAGILYFITAIAQFMSDQVMHGLIMLFITLGFAGLAAGWFYRGVFTLHVSSDGIRREGLLGWTVPRGQIVGAEVRKVLTICGSYPHLLVSLDPDTTDKPDMFLEKMLRFKLPRDPYLVVVACPADLDLSPLGLN